jgi:hypothetical protein
MIGDPYRVKKYWKKLLKMVKNAWESKLGVVYLHWGDYGGGGKKKISFKTYRVGG